MTFVMQSLDQGALHSINRAGITVSLAVDTPFRTAFEKISVRMDKALQQFFAVLDVRIV
jgi:hypothetical protein